MSRSTTCSRSASTLHVSGRWPNCTPVDAGISVDDAYEHMVSTIAAGRLGRPAEFGDACAFLCSAQAGYISGQNLQIDGGSYEGLI